MAAPKQQIGLWSAVAIGLASMLGAGVFVVFRDAYKLAGSWLFLALILAAIVATLNAASIYQLAKQVDRPGGTYAYARVYKNQHWSFAAGFAFVFGKIGSIAAIALVFGEYVFPQNKQTAAIAAIGVMVFINILGIQRTAAVASALAVTTTGFLVFSIVAPAMGNQELNVAPVAPASLLDLNVFGVFTASSVLFFAFAGYARVAALGTEVRNSKKNIPRAIAISLAIVVVIYFGISVALQAVLGSRLLSEEAPFVAYFQALGFGLDWLVVGVASAAALGSILALLAGVSRTAAEMATDVELPQIFRLKNRFGSPWVSEVLIALGAAALVSIGQISWVIGFSSFSVLFYYAIAHVSALAQPKSERLLPPALPIIGLALCLVLALSVPGPAVIVSTMILVAAFAIRQVAKPRKGN